MDRLSQALTQFGEHLARFNAREPVQYSLSALRLNTDWPWGHAKGVYCFVRGGRIQYVGRAIGSSSIGARLWSHINSLSDPAWADVINDDGTTVITLAFEPSEAHIAAAMEVYLIEKLHPPFNKRVG